MQSAGELHCVRTVGCGEGRRGRFEWPGELHLKASSSVSLFLTLGWLESEMKDAKFLFSDTKVNTAALQNPH